MIHRQTSLSANLIAFCRYLRKHGFKIGLSEEQDALLALQIINPFQDANHLKLCLQATLCRNAKQLQRFPALYQKYWLELDRAIDSKQKEIPEEKDQASSNQAQHQNNSLQAIKSWLYGNKNQETTEVASWSALEVYGQKGFPEFDESELKEVFDLVKKMVKKIANRRSRRYSISHKKAQLDLKRSLRKNITRSDEIIELQYRQKKKDQIKVVLICDVSRSMELYSRFLLQFMYAFQSQFSKIAAFVFSTQLYAVSEVLQEEAIQTSLEKMMQKVHTWSGGTKIGAALQDFVDKHGHRHLSSKTLTILLSDGWDNGDTDLIAPNMRAIKNKSLKVLWLNPLAGNENWQPSVKGMAAALPYIDALLPFHNLEDLREVVKNLRL